MKLSDLKDNQAVAVSANGVIELVDGDTVLVGIKCVYKDGKYYPLPKRIALIPDIFDDIRSDELVVIKRI